MPNDPDARWREPVPGEAAQRRRIDPALARQTDRPVEERELDRAAEDVVAPSVPPTGSATGASGGYGTGSSGDAVAAEAAAGAERLDLPDTPTSGGTGDGDDATSTAGDDAETDWLRRQGEEPR